MSPQTKLRMVTIQELAKYLGTIFTDIGVLKSDISLFLEKKNKEVNV